MKTKTLFVAGLLALTALALLPAPAAADPVSDAVSSASSTASVTVACLRVVCGGCPAIAGPSGGVVGATVAYANAEGATACNAARAELGIATAAAGAGCDATAQYLVGGSCNSLVVCSACAVVTIATSAGSSSGAPSAPSSLPSSMSMCCIPPPMTCATTAPGGSGVVPETEAYASGMAGIACGAAVATVGVAVQAAAQTCSQTGVYLLGQPNLCVMGTA